MDFADWEIWVLHRLTVSYGTSDTCHRLTVYATGDTCYRLTVYGTGSHFYLWRVKNFHSKIYLDRLYVLCYSMKTNTFYKEGDPFSS